MVKATPFVFNLLNGAVSSADSPDAENENVIVVNAPCPLAGVCVPAYRAYYHRPLPKTLRALVPGCTSFDVQRTDDKTLVIQSKAFEHILLRRGRPRSYRLPLALSTNFVGRTRNTKKATGMT